MDLAVFICHTQETSFFFFNPLVYLLYILPVGSGLGFAQLPSGSGMFRSCYSYSTNAGREAWRDCNNRDAPVESVLIPGQVTSPKRGSTSLNEGHTTGLAPAAWLSQRLHVPNWRAKGLSLHVAVGTGREVTAPGGIYQAFPCHKRSFQNSSRDSTGLQKSLRTYKQGSFLSNGRENTLKVQQIKEWCALSHTANGCVVPQLIKEPHEISRPPGWFQYSPAAEGGPRQMASPGFSKSFILLPQHGRNIESSSWCPSDTWPYPFHGHVSLPAFPPYLAGPLLQAPLSQTFNSSLTHRHQPTAISGIWKGIIAIRLWYDLKRIKIIGFMITPKTLLWDLGLFFITLSVLIKSWSWLLCPHAGRFAMWKSSVLCKYHRNSQNEIYNP